MLRIDNVEQIEGVTIYGDDRQDNKWYLVPEQPRMRLDEQGRPIFSFFKYRNPVYREDGPKGGFCTFDVEFVVPEQKVKKIREILQERLNKRYGSKTTRQVILGNITYTSGTAYLLLEKLDIGFIEEIASPGKPSLFGRNITSFALELTQEGATFFEQALQGSGGVIQVVYELYFVTKLPPLRADIYFNSQQFYRYLETLKVREEREGFFTSAWEGLFGGKKSDRKRVTERLRDSFVEHDIGRVEINFDFTLPNAEHFEKIKSEIRDWAWRTHDDAVARMLMGATASKDSSGGATSVGTLGEELKGNRPKDVTDLERRISERRLKDFQRSYRENHTVIWNINPNGSLPNFTTLKDFKNQPIKWEDYAKIIDLDDPFFRQRTLNVLVQADFENLPIHSVEVKVDYSNAPMYPGEYRFTSPDERAKFVAYVEGDLQECAYSYQINYQGESRIFQSETFVTTESEITITADDIGVLRVEVSPGDIDFGHVKQTQVIMQYEDPDNEVPLTERQFIIDQDHQNHVFEEVIFAPRRLAYRYRIRYIMQTGAEYQLDWTEGFGENLYVNDPFTNTRRIGIRAAGDLDKEIKFIYADFTYLDEDHDYKQVKSIALSRLQPFYDWEFPVIDENTGKLTYSGAIAFADGLIEDMPLTETTSNTPIIGEIVQDKLSIRVLAELLDFKQVRLVSVELQYRDEKNDIVERKSIVFGSNRPTEAEWGLKLKDKNQVEYEWKASYFFQDGPSQVVGPNVTDALTLILEMPA